MDNERIQTISDLKTKYNLGRFHDQALAVAAACYEPWGLEVDGAPYGYGGRLCYDLTDEILFQIFSKEDYKRIMEISIDNTESECANHMLWNLLIAMEAATSEDGLKQ